MKKLFTSLFLLCSLLTASAQKTATLVMSSSTKYQHIDGFGGTGMNGQWGDVYTQAKVDMLWGKGANQIGLNIMRVRINPNESNWGEYGNPIKWARKHGVTVFATPWTPPKRFKTHNTEKYKNEFGTWVWPLYEHSWGGEGSNGGAINPDSIESYARFLERYRATMQKKGCPIDMISIQNECDYTPTATDNGVEHASYESCIYSPKEMAAMVKAARAAVDSSCKIMGPETFGWGQSNYNKTLAALTDAQENIDVWGNHLYGSDDWTYINTVTSKTKSPMWMTEFLIDYSDGYSGAFSAEYDMVTSLENAMKNGYSGYVYYNMLNDFFAVNHGGSETQLWKRAYVFSHYAKYATGKTRIRSTLSDTSGKLIGGSSYISATGDTVTCFILNPSTDTYALRINLPFIAGKVTQVATGDNVNCYTLDVTDQYGGVKIPKVTLLPGIFYTFQFVKASDDEEVSEDIELATSPKAVTNASPLCSYQYMADPTSIEYDGRVYVYATNDQQEFDQTLGLQSNSYGKITQLVCMSSADMVNWTNHGVIDVKSIAPWIYTSWAPSIVSREESDGKTHFYMYFTNSASGIGVLTATSPLGPWKDPLGHALIDGNTSGLGKLSNIIDPGVAIYNDKGYLTFGGGDVTDSDLLPGNARIVQLGDDMISLASDIVKLPAPCHFEANELNVVGSKLLFSYCTRWSISSDWSSKYSTTAPTACSMAYMSTSDPLNPDAWTYKGVYLPNPGTLGYPYGNNHSHIQKFGSSYYIFYHNQWLENQNSLSGGYRNLATNRIIVNEVKSTITALTSTSATIKGASQITSARPNPYLRQPAEMTDVAAGIAVENTSEAGNTNVVNVNAGDWTMVRGVNFATADAEGNAQTARSFAARVKGSGTLQVYAGSLDSAPVATVNFDNADFDDVCVNLDTEISSFTNYLYFVFTAAKDVKFDSWQFYTTKVENADAIATVSTAVSKPSADIYTLGGVRVKAPQHGINIIGNKKVARNEE